MPKVSGIHHVTAIASDPQQNIDFYAGVLGLRLVKLTINYDDPSTYHLYFGDVQGHPGTILTFFPWLGATRGRIGTGQVTVISFAVPECSLGFWKQRLRERQVKVEEARSSFGEELLFFTDHDGLQLELVAAPASNPGLAWADGHIPADDAIRGFHHVTLSEEGYERTASLLTEVLGFKQTGRDGNRFRYVLEEGEGGNIVDLVCAPAGRPGYVAVGTVHHVAWRTPSDSDQVKWREIIRDLGYNVTPIIDRKYFHSIYFREPGGVLFEIATDPPGFTVDERLELLGSSLVLPPWLEPGRLEIQRLLPPVKLPLLRQGHE